MHWTVFATGMIEGRLSEGFRSASIFRGWFAEIVVCLLCTSSIRVGS